MGVAWEPLRSATWRFRFGRSPGFEILQLEEVASGWGIAREARDEALGLSSRNGGSGSYSASNNDPQAITAKHIAQAAIEGEERAEAILERAREGVAFALRQAIAVWLPAGSSSVAACP